jgi:Na+-driven multidrug efflux pump
VTTSTSRRQAALVTALGHGATVSLTVLQAFILLPLALAKLGPELFGAWLAASEVLVWIQLLDLGVPYLLVQRIGSALGRHDEDLAARWSATGLLVLVIVAGGLVTLGIASAQPVAAWVGVPVAHRPEFLRCFVIAVVASASILAFNGILALSRGAQRPAGVQVAQVMGVLSGLASSVVLLVLNWGLYALAIGLLVRAVVSLLGAVPFLSSLPNARRWFASPSGSVAAELRSLGPSLAASNLASVLSQNAELLIVASVFGPTSAAIYGLTRRAFDGLRNLMDAFAFAVSGGIAQLVTADQAERTRVVVRDTLWLRMALACLFAGAVVPVNETFVTLLFGREAYGGIGLTVAFSLQMVLGGQAFLGNMLLRSAGTVQQANWLLFADSCLRVLAIPLGLVLVGLVGAPWAVVFVSLWAIAMNHRGLDRSLASGRTATPRLSFVSFVGPAVVIGSGLLLSTLWVPLSWVGVVSVVVGLLCAGSILLVATRPDSLTLPRAPSF